MEIILGLYIDDIDAIEQLSFKGKNTSVFSIFKRKIKKIYRIT